MGSEMDWVCLGRFPAQEIGAAGPRVATLRRASLPQCAGPLASQENALRCAHCQLIRAGRRHPAVARDRRGGPGAHPLARRLDARVRPALLELGRRDWFARRCDESIAYNSSVLDVGARPGSWRPFWPFPAAAWWAWTGRSCGCGWPSSFAELRTSPGSFRASGPAASGVCPGILRCGPLRQRASPRPRSRAGLRSVAALVKPAATWS